MFFMEGASNLGAGVGDLPSLSSGTGAARDKGFLLERIDHGGEQSGKKPQICVRRPMRP
jgi:hypothetical protein